MGKNILGIALNGKKTYIMIVATICYALGGAVSGYVEWNTAIPLILGALGVGGLRDGVAKAEKPQKEVK